MTASSLRFAGDSFADVDELQRQFERLLGLRSPGAASIRSAARGAFPPVNIGSTPEAVEVYAFAPGIDAATLDVSVDKGLLTIAGERPDPYAAQQGQAQLTVHSRERPHGSFRRVIALPEDADAQRVDANYRNGVLRIRIEKRESSRPRRITVSDNR